MERLPYRATAHSAAYEGITRLPVAVLLDNVRSLYNVGAFFRTADGASIEKLYLCGITGRPPKKAISKTALGAEETVAWIHAWNAVPTIEDLRNQGYEIAAIETSTRSIDLFDWKPRFPYASFLATKSRDSDPSSSNWPIRTSAFRCWARSIR